MLALGLAPAVINFQVILWRFRQKHLTMKPLQTKPTRWFSVTKVNPTGSKEGAFIRNGLFQSMYR